MPEYTGDYAEPSSGYGDKFLLKPGTYQATILSIEIRKTKKEPIREMWVIKFDCGDGIWAFDYLCWGDSELELNRITTFLKCFGMQKEPGHKFEPFEFQGKAAPVIIETKEWQGKKSNRVETWGYHTYEIKEPDKTDTSDIPF